MSGILALASAGCSTVLAVRGEQARADANAVLAGTVGTSGYTARGPLVVGVLARGAQGLRLVDHFVAESAGAWVIPLPAGTYWLAAFEDANDNGRYDDEPAFRAEGDGITVAAGEHRTDLAIAIRRDGRLRENGFSVDELQARGDEEQQSTSLFALSVAGKVTSLDDPRFDPAVAASGLWKPYDFLVHAEPGIWFLEPYDSHRIPVLFVHGVGGTPRDLRPLIEGLDRTRFQAWVAYYPSGARLDLLGRWLSQLFVRLRSSLHFPKAAVVAYSMGGLVARAFVLDHFDAGRSDVVRTLVTISSPLGGMAAAGKGVEQSPVVIRSWYGLAPGSAFLDGLFYADVPTNHVRRRLPPHVAYHMLFGFHGDGPDDGVVPLASQLRPEAEEEARSVRGLDQTHTGILASKAALLRLNEILAELR